MDGGSIQLAGQLLSFEQQIEQLGLRQIEQSSQGLGACGLQRLTPPVQKAPDQQIVFKQSAPRPPAQAPQRLGSNWLRLQQAARWIGLRCLVHLRPLAAPSTP